jgi:hypothetical protein
MPQRLSLLFRAVLLHEIERQRERQHRDNDEKAAKITAYAGNRGGCYQEGDEGIENAPSELDEEDLTVSGFEQVRSVDSQALLGFLLGQSG